MNGPTPIDKLRIYDDGCDCAACCQTRVRRNRIKVRQHYLETARRDDTPDVDWSHTPTVGSYKPPRRRWPLRDVQAVFAAGLILSVYAALLWRLVQIVFDSE